MSDANAILEAALAYAERGIAVFPCHNPIIGKTATHCSCGKSDCDNVGKHPRYAAGDLEHGLKNATTTANRIVRWWEQWPDANIGAVPPEGLFVLDLDGPDAVTWWEQHETVPTRTAETGGGGRHLWFRGNGVRQNAGAIAPHVDVRTDKGYVIVPPSLHASENPYRWLTADDVPAAPAPAWLLELVTAKPPHSNGAAPAGEGAPIPEGRRNTTLASQAGKLRREGLEPEEVFAVIQRRNLRDCRPPLEDAEVRRIADSVARYEPEPAAPARIGQAGRPHRLQVEDSDPPVWLLTWPNGVVRVANPDLYIWSRSRDAHLAELKRGTSWAPDSRREWEQHVDGLLAALEQDPDGHLAVPPARTWHGRVAILLTEMAKRATWVGSRCRIDVDAERFYFRFPELVRRNSEDTHNQRGIDKERMTRPQLHVGLERLDAHVASGREESWIALRHLELEPET